MRAFNSFFFRIFYSIEAKRIQINCFLILYSSSSEKKMRERTFRFKFILEWIDYICYIYFYFRFIFKNVEFNVLPISSFILPWFFFFKFPSPNTIAKPDYFLSSFAISFSASSIFNSNFFSLIFHSHWHWNAHRVPYQMFVISERQRA